MSAVLLRELLGRCWPQIGPPLSAFRSNLWGFPGSPSWTCVGAKSQNDSRQELLRNEEPKKTGQSRKTLPSSQRLPSRPTHPVICHFGSLDPSCPSWETGLRCSSHRNIPRENFSVCGHRQGDWSIDFLRFLRPECCQLGTEKLHHENVILGSLNSLFRLEVGFPGEASLSCSGVWEV